MTLRPIDTLRLIRLFLFSKTNREFLIFLLFLAVSGIFWLMMTLNEAYEQEVRIPVRYINVPQNAVLTSGESDSIRINISDKGFSLFAFVYSSELPAIDIDFTKYASSDGTCIVRSCSQYICNSLYWFGLLSFLPYLLLPNVRGRCGILAFAVIWSFLIT